MKPCFRHAGFAALRRSCWHGGRGSRVTGPAQRSYLIRGWPGRVPVSAARLMNDERAISLHGPNGLHIHGTLSEDGRFSLHAAGGGHIHGNTNGGGRITLHGGDGSYYHGVIGEDGSISIHGPNGL